MSLRVEVVLPLHGGEPWIHEAIASVLAQSHRDWHLTVVDDASPDAGAERVEALRREHPERIDLLRLEESRRAAGARMWAIERTASDLLAFLDQDDRWLPEKLALQVARFQADPGLGAVHGDVEIIDARGHLQPGAADRENAARRAMAWGSGPALAARLFQKNAIRLGSALLRRSAFEAAGGFDVSLFGGEDWEFWVRFADRFPIAHVPEVVLQRRVHGGNVSRVHARERARGKLRALERMERRYAYLAPHVPARRKEILDQAAGADADEPLALARTLFERLAAEGVRYCHWKSNEHVAAALAGRTDFDLLVAEADRARFDAVLAELDFREILSPPEKRFPGMEDRLGFDRETGRLLHLHVHYRLVLGEPRIKNHHLPLEEQVLAATREIRGVRAPAAELELLLLAVRAPLKVSPRRLVQRWRRDGTKTLPSSLVREMEFLLPDVDPQRFRAAIAAAGLRLDADALLAFVGRACDRSLTTPEIARVRRAVLRGLRPFRRRPALRALLAGWRARRLARGPRPKRLPHRGPILALVGADGSGKSSLCADLREWLGWKLRCEQAYFGIPKDDPGYRRLRAAGSGRDAERWLLVARHRVAERRRAEGIAAEGGVVIADRYPMPELWAPPEPMDGPRLAGRPEAEREQALYARIPPPDRAFVLRTPAATLRARKDDLPEEVQRRKAEQVNALPDREPFCPVDGDRPYEEVLLDLKRRIWDSLAPPAAGVR